VLSIVANALSAQPPCRTPLNPALETICYTTKTTDGNFSIRLYAEGLNVSLISAVSPNYGSWATNSIEATEFLFYYFDGENAEFKPVVPTVPLIYRPSLGANPSLTASMALPTSVFPNPASAPRPSEFDKEEAFPAITIAAFRFDTPAIATDLQYSYACGQLGQWASERGLAPIPGPWAQAWVTYSTEAASPHVNECWAQVAA
jgi:hypothetical protein